MDDGFVSEPRSSVSRIVLTLVVRTLERLAIWVVQTYFVVTFHTLYLNVE